MCLPDTNAAEAKFRLGHFSNVRKPLANLESGHLSIARKGKLRTGHIETRLSSCWNSLRSGEAFAPLTLKIHQEQTLLICLL